MLVQPPFSPVQEIIDFLEIAISVKRQPNVLRADPDWFARQQPAKRQITLSNGIKAPIPQPGTKIQQAGMSSGHLDLAVRLSSLDLRLAAEHGRNCKHRCAVWREFSVIGFGTLRQSVKKRSAGSFARTGSQ